MCSCEDKVKNRLKEEFARYLSIPSSIEVENTDEHNTLIEIQREWCLLVEVQARQHAGKCEVGVPLPTKGDAYKAVNDDKSIIEAGKNQEYTTRLYDYLTGESKLEAFWEKDSKSLDVDNKTYSYITTCHTCEGVGEETCSLCYGAGKVNCSTCGGRGESSCISCSGTGEQCYNGVWKRCSSCSGLRHKPCSSCSSGTVNCHQCTNGKAQCNSCSGSGDLTHELSLEVNAVVRQKMGWNKDVTPEWVSDYISAPFETYKWLAPFSELYQYDIFDIEISPIGQFPIKTVLKGGLTSIDTTIKINSRTSNCKFLGKSFDTVDLDGVGNGLIKADIEKLSELLLTPVNAKAVFEQELYITLFSFRHEVIESLSLSQLPPVQNGMVNELSCKQVITGYNDLVENFKKHLAVSLTEIPKTLVISIAILIMISVSLLETAQTIASIFTITVIIYLYLKYKNKFKLKSILNLIDSPILKKDLNYASGYEDSKYDLNGNKITPETLLVQVARMFIKMGNIPSIYSDDFKNSGNDYKSYQKRFQQECLAKIEEISLSIVENHTGSIQSVSLLKLLKKNSHRIRMEFHSEIFYHPKMTAFRATSEYKNMLESLG